MAPPCNWKRCRRSRASARSGWRSCRRPAGRCPPPNCPARDWRIAPSRSRWWTSRPWRAQQRRHRSPAPPRAPYKGRGSCVAPRSAPPLRQRLTRRVPTPLIGKKSSRSGEARAANLGPHGGRCPLIPSPPPWLSGTAEHIGLARFNRNAPLSRMCYGPGARSGWASGAQPGVDHHVAQVAATSVVEGATAGNQAEFGVRDGTVDRGRREVALGVDPDRGDDEDRQGSVGAPHVDALAGPHVLQPEEDAGSGTGVDVAGDDGRPGRAGTRATGIPAGHRGRAGDLEGAVPVEAEGDDRGLYPDGRDGQPDRLGGRLGGRQPDRYDGPARRDGYWRRPAGESRGGW